MFQKFTTSVADMFGRFVVAAIGEERLTSILQTAADVAVQDRMEQIDEDDLIERIANENPISEREVIREIVDNFEVDSDRICEEVFNAIDMDEIGDGVANLIDTDDIRDRAIEQVCAEVQRDVVDGLIEDGAMHEEVAKEVVAALKTDDGTDLFKRIVKAVVDELTERIEALNGQAQAQAAVREQVKAIVPMGLASDVVIASVEVR